MSLTNAIELLGTHKFAQFSSYLRYYKLLNVTPYGTTTIIMDIIIQLYVDYLTLGRLACTCLGQTFFLYIKVRNRSRYTLNHLNYILFLVIRDFRFQEPNTSLNLSQSIPYALNQLPTFDLTQPGLGWKASLTWNPRCSPIQVLSTLNVA